VATLLTETWTGTTGAAWPAGWTTREGTNTIQTNAGRLSPGTGAYATACSQNTGMASAGDTDLVVSVKGVAGTPVEKYAYAFIDSDGGNTAGNWEPDNCYFGYIEFGNPTTASIVHLGQSVGGVVTALGTPLTKTLAGTTKYWLRVQRIGTTLQVKVWDAAGAEPGTWDVTATVSSPMSGKVGLLCANGAANTNRQFDFDDLTVTDGSTGTTYTPTGIASGEAFGTATETGTVTAAPTGIASAEAFGTVTANVVITGSPTGIASAEAFGTATETGALTASPTGIGSGEAFGAVAMTGALTASPGGIATGEVFGTPTANKMLTSTPTGIASGEAFGAPSAILPRTASPGGIASAEAFGSPTVNTGSNVVPVGIASAEAFGAPTAIIPRTASPTGIGSGEAFGTPVETGALTASPTGIVTAEAFGTPTAVKVLVATATGITTAEAFGTASAIKTLLSTPGGIVTAEAFGTPTATVTFRSSPTGIASAEAFGAPTATLGPEATRSLSLAVEALTDRYVSVALPARYHLDPLAVRWAVRAADIFDATALGERYETTPL
jgi:hypothetical protein